MIEFFLNDLQLELDNEVSVSLSFIFRDSISLNINRASFSNTIRVPITNHNDNVIKSVRLLNVIDEDSLRKTLIPAKIGFKGLKYINGVAMILQTTDTHYEFQVLDKPKEWFIILRERSVNELDFGIHVLDKATISTTWSLNGAGPREYIYALYQDNNGVDPGIVRSNGSGGMEVNVWDMRPSLWLRHVISKMFEDAGFEVEYKGDFINRQEIRDLVLMYINRNLFTTAAFVANLTATGTQNGDDQIWERVKVILLADCPGLVTQDDFMEIFKIFYDFIDVVDPNDLIRNGGFKAVTKGDYTIDYVLNIEYGCQQFSVNASVSRAFEINEVINEETEEFRLLWYSRGYLCQQPSEFDVLFRNRVDFIVEGQVVATVEDPTEPRWLTALDVLSIDSVTFHTSDPLFVLIEVNFTQGFTSDTTSKYVNLAVTCPDSIQTTGNPQKFIWRSIPPTILTTSTIAIQGTGEHEAGEGSDIPLTGINLPDINQLTLLKSFQQMTNTFFITQGNKVTVIHRDDFYKTTDNSIDWTDKLHRGEKEEEDVDENISKKYTFSYAEDSNDLLASDPALDPENINGSFTFDKEKLKGETNVTADMIFAPTRRAVFLGNQFPSFVVEEDTILTPRIMIYQGLRTMSVDTFDLIGKTSDNSHPNYPFMYFGHPTSVPGLLSLFFGTVDGLIINAWQSELDLLNNARFLKALFDLTGEDLSEIDILEFFGSLRVIDGNYYILDTIKNYNINGRFKTLVHLISTLKSPV